jgi:hypothetical protein
VFNLLNVLLVSSGGAASWLISACAGRKGRVKTRRPQMCDQCVITTLQLEGSYDEGLSLKVDHMDERFFLEYWVQEFGSMPERLERITITHREARLLVKFINSHLPAPVAASVAAAELPPGIIPF